MIRLQALPDKWVKGLGGGEGVRPAEETLFKSRLISKRTILIISTAIHCH